MNSKDLKKFVETIPSELKQAIDFNMIDCLIKQAAELEDEPETMIRKDENLIGLETLLRVPSIKISDMIIYNFPELQSSIFAGQTLGELHEENETDIFAIIHYLKLRTGVLVGRSLIADLKIWGIANECQECGGELSEIFYCKNCGTEDIEQIITAQNEAREVVETQKTLM